MLKVGYDGKNILTLDATAVKRLLTKDRVCKSDILLDDVFFYDKRREGRSGEHVHVSRLQTLPRQSGDVRVVQRVQGRDRSLQKRLLTEGTTWKKRI